MSNADKQRLMLIVVLFGLSLAIGFYPAWPHSIASYFSGLFIGWAAAVSGRIGHE